MNTDRNNQHDQLPWPAWMTGPGNDTARAVAETDTIVLNRAALDDALTHNQRPDSRDAPTPPAASPAATTAAPPRTDTGPWLALMILGLLIVAVMLTITMTWR
ncbi:hypothetical protein Ae263Ps1_6414c [Pseudonocardia sp. Ae263_Ps1]|uniref:hypothetical protein n=1 Tax=Pseudonocardia sp. Ae263_Ps1 TaxID=1885030 RepID=UPI00094AC4EC|nr:hypothetical protein [Pseudonocardia sp. Ae263_Ps1]OLL69861.1 hypothetical protein Ae263Ps1_6414c [Pseudonocardia sp. Ae263_Ps1]